MTGPRCGGGPRFFLSRPVFTQAELGDLRCYDRAVEPLPTSVAAKTLNCSSKSMKVDWYYHRNG